MRVIDKIRAILNLEDWNQSKLAERQNVSQSTVNRWLAGAEPKGNRRDAINDLYDELFGEGNEISIVPVMGRVGAGAEIEPDFEQVPEEGLEQIEVEGTLPADMIAFRVYGDSMLPRYDDGDVIICWREQKRGIDSFYGEEAVVRTVDGRRFLKSIMRAGDGVSLFSWNARPIENVDLAWVGEIHRIYRGSQFRRLERARMRANGERIA